jgi:hypothetical protein
MPLTKPYKIALTAIALVVLAVAASLWLLGRTSFVRDKVSGWVTEATGLPATVESVSIGFLRGPSFELHGLAIAQPPGFGAEPLIEVGNTRITAPWSSLFGDPVAHSVTIDEAVLRAAVAADGSDNWSALIEHLTADEDEEPAPAWAVGRLEVRKGAVEYDDAEAGTQFRLTAITIGATDVSAAADFPVDLEVAGVSGTHTFLLACKGRGLADTDAGRFAATTLNVRGWAGGEPLPLAGVELLGQIKAVTFDSGSGIAAIDGGSFNLAGIPGEFAGSLHIDEPDERTLITFRTKAFAPRAPAIAFGMPLPPTADASAFSTFQISVEGRMRDGVLHLDPIEGRLDQTQFNGRFVPEQRLVRVTADRIEIDRYLAPDQKRRRQKKATLEAAISELEGYDIDAEIRIGEARVAGARLRDAVIRVERTGTGGT